MFISRLLWCTSSLHHHQKQTTIIIFGYTPFSNKLSSSSRIKKPSRRVKSSQVNSLLNSTNSCGLEFSSSLKSKHAKLQDKKSILMPIICHFILDLVSRFLLSKKWFLQTCHVEKRVLETQPKLVKRILLWWLHAKGFNYWLSWQTIGYLFDFAVSDTKKKGTHYCN